MSGNQRNNFIYSHKVLLVSLFCLWQAVGVMAQTPSPTASPGATPTPYNPVKDMWQLGFTVLKDRQLSQENKYLCYSLPLLLKQSLQTISGHKLSEEEKTIYRQKQLNVELVALQKKLDGLKLTRDKKFFNKSLSSQQQLEKSEDEQARQDLVKQINEIAVKDLTTISIQDNVKVAIKVHQPLNQLFPLPVFSLFESAKSNALDLLISGEIEEIQDYLYVHISLFNILQEKVVVDFEYATAPDKIFDAVPKIIDKLAAYILGRPWAALTVKPAPDVSTIELNGELKGLGQVAALFIEPGEYKVKVMHAGYKTHEETVTLAAGEKKELAIKLEEANFKTFTIDTDPPEAAIYLNSLWKGKSPLELHLDELPQSMIIKKDGYREKRVELGEDSPEKINLSLNKDVYDLSKRQQQKRDDFYRSLGFFAVSVPVPLLFYYYWRDSYVNVDNLSGVKRETAITQSNYLYYACGAGIFITASLFVYMAVNLMDYVQATNNLQDG